MAQKPAQNVIFPHSRIESFKHEIGRGPGKVGGIDLIFPPPLEHVVLLETDVAAKLCTSARVSAACFCCRLTGGSEIMHNSLFTRWTQSLIKSPVATVFCDCFLLLFKSGQLPLQKARQSTPELFPSDPDFWRQRPDLVRR